jgi:hypothetical protein
VFFTQRDEVRDANGDWVASGSSDAPDDLTGSSISIAGLYGPNPESGVELSFSLDLVSPTNAWADGVSITFPAGVTILNAPSFEAGGGPIVPEIVGNTINMGLVSGELTQNGIFHGGETWSIFIANPTLPLAVDWVVYDDGYADPAGPTVNAVGTFSVETIGSLARTAKYWNLRDVTTGTVLLENQGIIGGEYLFPPRDDYSAAQLNPTTTADPIVDGFQVGVSVVYEAPINFSSERLTLSPENSPTTLSSNSTTTNLDIQNYTIFSGTISSNSLDNFGVGTIDINQLQQDYELRFTGVWADTVIGGRTVKKIVSGGQMATCFRIAGGFAAHPLNESGVDAPFLLRIPFEVWNIADPNNKFQVNLTFRDRIQNSATSDPMYAWNPVNRMYAIIVNSPYDTVNPIQVDGGPDALNALATWVLVFYGTNYTLGDVVTVSYDNPIQIGVDKYLFNTNGSSFSNELAKTQVDKINVFPNPYYGVNTEELNKYNKFVTFSHLPEKATIRIFNLAGVHVRTINKDDIDQFLRWDLANTAGLPVASGLYLAYIDLPDLGETKILKIAVIQEQQILDRF